MELVFEIRLSTLSWIKAIEYKLGARGLRSIVETVMVDPMFEVPSSGDKSFIVTGDFVNSQLEKAHFGKMEIK